MNGFPPPVLVETWLFLTNSNSPELKYLKLPLHNAIKHFFGSNELAQLYIEQFKDKEIEVHYV
jgi:hypothetical protein